MATDFHASITVTAETRDQAEQVLAERLNHDEDYGFDYQLGHSPAGRTPLITHEQVHAAIEALILEANDPNTAIYNNGVRDFAKLILGKETGTNA